MSGAKVLVTIVTRGMGESISVFFNKKYPQATFLSMGYGTASSEIMGLLGLDTSDKDFIVSLVGDHDLQQMLDDISGRKVLSGTGSGIAFTLPLNGISSLVHAALTQNAPENKEENMDTNKAKDDKKDNFSLVVVISDPGYSDDIMELARAAGARGGTVISSRGIGHSEAGHFLGINIQAEKELVLVLAQAEQRIDIMKTLNEKFGTRTKSQALVLSLPVEDMVQVS